MKRSRLCRTSKPFLGIRRQRVSFLLCSLSGVSLRRSGPQKKPALSCRMMPNLFYFTLPLTDPHTHTHARTHTRIVNNNGHTSCEDRRFIRVRSWAHGVRESWMRKKGSFSSFFQVGSRDFIVIHARTTKTFLWRRTIFTLYFSNTP